jgi:hypothetical protein
MNLMDMKVESGITDGWRSPVNLSLTKVSAFFVVLYYEILQARLILPAHVLESDAHFNVVYLAIAIITVQMSSCFVQLILVNLVPL